MDAKDLARVDLNLFVALQRLLEEESVTKAATRLHITQPAMSKTLQRLRETFNDPLFVRSGRGLSATPRAIELKSQLPSILTSIANMLINDEFDPSSYEGEVFIMCAEFIAVQVMPGLIQTLIEEAPFMTIRLVAESSDTKVSGLEKGDLDFAIEISRTYTDDYYATALGKFLPAVWMRDNHPLADNDNLNLSEMLKYPFVQYALLRSQSGDTIQQTRFDTQLKAQGQKRKKALVTAQLMTALNVLCSSDSLMMGTMSNLKIDGITRKVPPTELDLDPIVNIALVQHSRTLKSELHNWVKEKISQTLVKVKNST